MMLKGDNEQARLPAYHIVANRVGYFVWGREALSP